MLHPKANRIDYGSQLIPPDGYRLDRAVGTTYSLDLEALMILPVALFYAQPLDGDPSQMRYDMLDAITKASEKISIFCQKGQIKVLNKFHHLIAFWEKGIHEVQMPDHAQSFHPKIWVIRYTHESLNPIYRLIVTSRNLTFARDWDIAFSTEGIVDTDELKENLPLVDFLRYLQRYNGAAMPESFVQDLLRVKFDIDLNAFKKFRLYPIGIRNELKESMYINPTTTKKEWDEVLIVSPFVDDRTLNTLANSSRKKPSLFSRKDELDGINPTTLKKFSCFQFSNVIERSEFYSNFNESDLDCKIQNLHAKLIVTQVENKVAWYFGSANCTDPAQSRNIEFLVELKSEAAPGTKPRDLFKQFTDPAKSEGALLFEPYIPENRVDVSLQKKIELEIRKIKFQLCEMSIDGEAIPVEHGTAYDLKITIDAQELILPDKFSVKLKPIGEDQKLPVQLNAGAINEITDFTGFAETRLSPFIEFEIWYDEKKFSSFLTTMDIELPASRLNRIFSSIINSRDKFLKYLNFLLTGEETTIIDKQDNSNGEAGAGFRGIDSNTPIYEKLLIAASRYPEKLVAANKLVERLKAETSESGHIIVTPEFEDFWKLFRSYLNSINHG